MADADKEKLNDVISNLELATGQILFRDPHLTSIIIRMREDLRTLRALLQVYRPQ